MATDDNGENDPFNLPLPLGVEQRQDALVSMPLGGEPEFDVDGVQDPPARGRPNKVGAGAARHRGPDARRRQHRAVIVYLICSVVPVPLAIIEFISHIVPHGLGVIGAIVGGVPVVVLGFGGFWHDKLRDKDRGILTVAGAVGLVAVCVLLASIGFAPTAGA